MNKQLHLTHIILIILCFCPFSSTGNGTSDVTLKTIEEKVYYYPRQAEKMLDSLLQHSATEIEEKQPAELSYLKAFMAYQKGELDEALQHLETALMIFIRENQPEGQAKCYLLMGWISESDSYLEQAKIYYYKTIQLFNNKPGVNTGLAYLGLVRCKKILNEAYDNDLNTGVKIIQSVGKDEFALYAQFIYHKLNLNGPESTKQMLDIAEKFLKLGLNNNATNIYKALASYYLKIKEPDSAHFYVDKALRWSVNDYPGFSMIPGLNQLKGCIYNAQKDFESARRQFNLSLKLYESCGQMPRSFYAYYALHILDKKQGNYKGALDNLILANKYRNKADLKEKQRMAKVLETAARVSSLNERISTLKTRTKVLTYSSLTIFAFITIIFMIVAFIIYEKRQKTKKIETELQTLLSLFREKELTINHILNSNGLISEKDVDTKVNNISDSFPGLFNLFMETFPQLGKTDIEYALMFALGYSNETITKFNNIKPSSLRKVNQRIRQKLELEKNCDLGPFFQKHIKS